MFTLTPSVEDQSRGATKVSIQGTEPSSPSNGDYWLDTSGTDTNIGNARAGVLIPAATISAVGRFQIESIGLEPSVAREAA